MSNNMSLTRIVWLTTLLSLFSMPTQAVEVEGIEMPESIKPLNTSLNLNGTGVRHKFFLDLYVAGLYLQQPTQDGQTIIQTDEDMAIRIHIISGMITPKRMADSTREGFENSMDGNTEPLKDKIDHFISVFDDIEKGDVYELAYGKTKGVTVFKNDEQMLEIGGLDFKQALFGIWLSDEPAEKSLKLGMLGKN